MADPIVIERIIDSTPHEAFELFTQPERLRRWQAVSASVDLRVDGEYRLTIVPGNIASGTFSEIEPGRRVVYTWGWVGDENVAPGSSTVEVEFEAVGDRTAVRLTHKGLDAEAASGHREGWDTTPIASLTRPHRETQDPTRGVWAWRTMTISARSRPAGICATTSWPI